MLSVSLVEDVEVDDEVAVAVAVEVEVEVATAAESLVELLSACACINADCNMALII
ncbi:hypothetical protein [Telmatospirillum sp.]|uniref:hypothetical protein n=1 Tax=Telmatospirillum sp. TaxID=2079197 RepID=UPI0028454D16|nr:hypothetical protein [Telmatospirillum sp.]MDR3436346.1 hypothetical protein [Telmatospirillum sp.]